MNSYLGQICTFSFNFAPSGWLPCDGRLLPIDSNQGLFSLMGNQYGGNGKTNFALPNLNGRSAVGITTLGGDLDGLTPVEPGQTGGASYVTLTTDHLPPHNHLLPASELEGTTTHPAGAAPAKLTDSLGLPVATYGVVTPPTTVQMADTLSAGSAAPAPVPLQNAALALGFYISNSGDFPPRA